MYGIRILEAATRELEHLDKTVASRIAERISWLAANLDSISPEALAADLAGLYKLRAGDYRILYEILRGEHTVVIHAVGHRSNIYKKR